MMARFLKTSSWSLIIEQDSLDTTCGIDTIDESWRATDSNGHEHYYERFSYPTLERVIDAEHWCDGTEGIGLHDPHMAVDEAHFECLICREVVKPGIVPAGTPTSIPGPIRATLSGPTTDGRLIEMPATEAEVDAIKMAAEGERDAVAQRILDEAPADRIYRTETVSAL